MKVAYITNSRIPAVFANGIQVMKMCEAIAKLGHNLTLIIPINEKENFQLKEEDIFSFYGVERTFDIQRTPFRKIFIHDLTSSLYAKMKKVDLCYTISAYAAYFAPRLGIPTAFEAHNPLHHLRLRGPVAPIIFNSPYVKIITVSNWLTRFYIENYGVNPQKIITKPNGVDIEKFTIVSTKEEVRRELNLPQNKRIICYTGNLYKGRGIELLLSVSKQLTRDSLILIVGGRSGDLEKYKSISLQMGCTNVHFIGFVLNNAVPKYLAASDVLVMPYQRDTEDPSGQIQTNYMCPMKMFEYMASGRPIVASNLDQIKEVLRDSENALLFDPGDETAFLNLIKIALEDKEVAQKIAKNAQDQVKNYTWAKRAKEIFSFL